MIQTPKQEDDHLIDRRQSFIEVSTSAAGAGLCVGVAAQVGQAVMSLPSDILTNLAVGGWTTFVGGALTALAQRHHIAGLEYAFINKYGSPQDVAQGQELQQSHVKAASLGAAGYGMAAASVMLATQVPKAIGNPVMQSVAALAVVSTAAVAAYPLVANMIKHRRARQHLAQHVAQHGSDLPQRKSQPKPKA